MTPTEKDSPIQVQKLSSDNDFYTNVFKKTEQIVSAVFYVMSYIETNVHSKVHIESLTIKATEAHEAALESLEFVTFEAKDRLFTLQRSLVALQSYLLVAAAARVWGTEVNSTILHEIDNVLRYIKNHYTKETSQTLPVPKFSADRTTLRRPRRERISIPKNDLSSDAILVYSALSDRTTRIKTVLEAKPEATIKDLTDIITDVSSKTIQRDLNSLIESGEVIRQGERRWSKYSIKPAV